jgi:hypothetical protein
MRIWKMSETYAEKKLFEAVYCLATGMGPLRERLVGAAECLIGPLSAAHFPNRETARVWEGLYEDLTIFEADPGEGKIHTTIKNLIDSDLVTIAKRIIELYARISRMNRERTE